MHGTQNQGNPMVMKGFSLMYCENFRTLFKKFEEGKIFNAE